MGGDPADAADAQSLRDCLHEVLESLDRLLERIAAGELGQPPAASQASLRRPGGQRPRRLAVAGRGQLAGGWRHPWPLLAVSRT